MSYPRKLDRKKLELVKIRSRRSASFKINLDKRSENSFKILLNYRKQVTLISNCKNFIHPAYRISPFFGTSRRPNCIFSSVHLSSASNREFFPSSTDSKGAPDGAGTSVELIAGRTMSRWPVAASRGNDRWVFCRSSTRLWPILRAYIQVSYRGLVLVDYERRFWPWFLWSLTRIMEVKLTWKTFFFIIYNSNNVSLNEEKK